MLLVDIRDVLYYGIFYYNVKIEFYALNVYGFEGIICFALVVFFFLIL